MARKQQVSGPVANPQPPDYRSWEASDWDELSAIWRELFPEPTAEQPAPEPKFRDQGLSSQQAGDVFERWVLQAFRHDPAGSQLRCVDSYRNPADGKTVEQIDGLIFDGWQAFLIESKNWGDRIDFAPLAKFHHAVERRPIGLLGLFFAPNGYTDPALELVTLLRPIRVLLFDGRDLNWAVENRTGMLAMVRRKWELAVQYGDPSLPVAGRTSLEASR